MWILDKNKGWTNVSDEQFLAMSKKANGIELNNKEVEVLKEIEKPRKTRAKKQKA